MYIYRGREENSAHPMSLTCQIIIFSLTFLHKTISNSQNHLPVTMQSTFSLVFPPAPTFTEQHLPSLSGKVIIITGAASGVGFELAKILYAASATVYIAARSQTRCDSAVQKIKAQVQFGRGKEVGRLETMVIDLADLRTVKGAVEEFLRREERLDVLVNNAAVMQPAVGSKDPLVSCRPQMLCDVEKCFADDGNWQGHDLEMSTNCLGPYLLSLLLEPILARTAASLPPFAVRIVWVATMLQAGGAPGDGMAFDKNGTPEILQGGMNNYFQSKAGVTWLASDFAKRLGGQGILSVVSS